MERVVRDRLIDLAVVVGLVLFVAGLPRIVRALSPNLAVWVAALEGEESDPWGNPWGSTGEGGSMILIDRVLGNTQLPSPSQYSVGPNGIDEAQGGDDVTVDFMRGNAPRWLDVRLLIYRWWVLLGLGVVSAWFAAVRPQFRRPRGPLGTELGRSALIASVPAALAVGLLLYNLPPTTELPPMVQVPARVAGSVTLAGLVLLLVVWWRMRREPERVTDSGAEAVSVAERDELPQPNNPDSLPDPAPAPPDGGG